MENSHNRIVDVVVVVVIGESFVDLLIIVTGRQLYVPLCAFIYS